MLMYGQLQNSCPDTKVGLVGRRLAPGSLYTMTGRLEKRFCPTIASVGAALTYS